MKSSISAFFRNASSLIATLTVLLFVGCSSTPKSQNMVYSGKVSGKFNHFLLNGINSVSTTRGGQLSAEEKHEAGIEAFESALKESLLINGLFSDKGRFHLKVRILKVLQPPGHFDLEVTAHVMYTLADSTTGKVVFKETVISDHTAHSTDAFFLDNRRRLANEGAGKRNIALFLT